MKLLNSNDPLYRLLRTIIQGVIGVIIANLDLIIGTTSIPGNLKPLIVALIMACLSPIMAYMGKYDDETDPVIIEDEIDDYVTESETEADNE